MESTIIPSKSVYLKKLDSTQQTVCQRLFGLPPLKMINGKKLSLPQSWEWGNAKNQWEWNAFRLVYFLVKRQGFDLPDPLEHRAFNKFSKKRIDTISRLLLAELDLLTEGWRIVKSTAISERGCFPFDHPIEAFGEVCRYRMEFEAGLILTEETITEGTLSSFQSRLKSESSLFRKPDTFHKKDQELNFYRRSEDWANFAIYAIWDYRHSREMEDLADAWRKFLKAHRQYVSMYCYPKKFFGDNRVSVNYKVFTNEGRVFIRHNRRLLEEKLKNGQRVFA